eukprot:3659288-Pyramimonas_sp.AAC.1
MASDDTASLWLRQALPRGGRGAGEGVRDQRAAVLRAPHPRGRQAAPYEPCVQGGQLGPAAVNST